MKRKALSALVALYAAAVIGIGVHQYLDYRHGFERITPYSHTADEAAWETAPETQPVRELPAQTEPLTETAAPTETLPADEPTEPATQEIRYPLDLNTATFEELCTLPDIGEVLAQAILDYRTQHGGFRNREQLLEIDGIGEKRYAQIAPLLFLVNEQPLATDAPATDAPPPDVQPEQPPTEPPTIPVIDLNTATREDLLMLPGCDETIADSILHLREEIGGYSNPLEIVMAEEVSDALYIAWKDYLTVGEKSEELP